MAAIADFTSTTVSETLRFMGEITQRTQYLAGNHTGKMLRPFPKNKSRPCSPNFYI